MKIFQRIGLLVCLTGCSILWVNGQEITYSGTVTSDDGQPVIGASVQIVGTNTGVSTGISGDYSIATSPGKTLRFSFLGMETVEVTTGTTPRIDVVLNEQSVGIDDIVVVAYGTSKKKDLTGAIGSLDTKLITSQSNSTVSKALEGSIAGVQIGTLSGQPGADANILVRGLGTAQGKAGALIVIDGVPNANPNALAILNPRDIESIVVSKDAASNSLYGSRGANGVVLVTTRQGKTGKPRVSLDVKFGINSQGVRDWDRIRDPKEVYEYAWQSIYNSVRYKDVDYIDDEGNGWKGIHQTMSHAQASEFASKYLFKYDGTDVNSTGWMQNDYNGLGNYMLYSLPGATYDANGIPNNGIYLINPETGKLNENAKRIWYDDWRDQFNKPSFRQEYNVSISGGSETNDYFISGGYLNDPSYVTGSKFDRYNFRLNLNSQINDWLKAGGSASYSRRYLQQPAVRWGGYNPGTVSQNVFYWMNGINALKPLWARDLQGNYKYDDDGKRVMDLGSGETDSPFGPTYRSGSGITPLVMAKQDLWSTTTVDLSGRAYVEATFLKDFKIHTNISLEDTYAFEDRYNNREIGDEKANQGRIRQQYYDYLIINTQQLLTWSHDYGKHHVDALLGHEYYWYQDRRLNTDKYMTLINGMNDYGNAIGINSLSGSQNKLAMEGYFSRVNYNYDSKYYVSASIRGDGSSKFKTAGKRWGTFWSVGGAWRISAENWMQNATWLNELKLRATYGTMGNQNYLSNYAGYNLWNLGNSGDIKNPQISITQGTLGNENLTWETVKTWDVGLDFRLWDRFYGTIDWYRRDTYDMIWDRPNASSTGETKITENSASMRNSGIEIELGVDIIRTPEFFWNFSVNGTHYENKLTSLPAGVGSDELGGNYEASTQNTLNCYLRGVGKPYYNLYLAKYAGVDQNTGLAMLYHTVDKSDHDNGRWKDYAIGSIVRTVESEYITRYEIGDATPKFMGGFSTSFAWKNFDLSASFAYQIGGWFLSNEFAYGGYSAQGIGGVYGKVWQNAWTPTNRESNYPMRMLGGTNYGITYGTGLFTDLGVFKASYLSVKNITLGYSLPQKLMDSWRMQGIRVYVSLDNFWLVSAMKGLDPRLITDNVGDAGTMVGAYAYPAIRSASLGISVNF